MTAGKLPPLPKLRLIHVELAEANAFVEKLHRHHKRVVGHKFSLGAMESRRAGEMGCDNPFAHKCSEEGCPPRWKLVGVAIVGRPVARMRDDGVTLEVTRLCTDGTRNACSFLYGACARAAFALGYERIGTYTLGSEEGASLRGAGWRLLGERGGGTWNRANRERTDKAPVETKRLWEVTA